MRSLICCFLLLVIGCPIVSAQPDDLQGFSSTQLQSALAKAGIAAQRLYSVRTFGEGELARPAYMAVLSVARSGWRIAVFQRVQGGFKLEWHSHNLPIEFSVSSARNFSIENIGDEATVMFSGCAPHDCGGDFQGFFLYSTARKEAFFALLTHEKGQPRRVTFSENALETVNQSYKDALQRNADEVIRRTDLR